MLLGYNAGALLSLGAQVGAAQRATLNADGSTGPRQNWRSTDVSTDARLRDGPGRAMQVYGDAYFDRVYGPVACYTFRVNLGLGLLLGRYEAGGAVMTRDLALVCTGSFYEKE